MVTEKQAFTHSNPLRHAPSQINFTSDKQILHSAKKKKNLVEASISLEFEKPPSPLNFFEKGNSAFL